MSFDKSTRNLLANLVAECRRLLTADIRDQLQRAYGLQPDGTDLSVASLQHLDEPGLEIAEELRIWREHLAVTEHGTEQKRRIAAFERLAQETAFTALNRLAALRLCEERGHILECVRRGMESDGFALYERLCGGALGSRGETYRQFLYRVFDELAQDLGVLFDRRQPQSLVFPGERCLEDVLALLNDPALRHLWQEDETIGWIYQYYNSQEERRQMREESAAPRNSHELAVRNQFFTPRYVVEFLTDNTLGRIWYEMTKGRTRLSEQCRYLVRRPKEIFLGDIREAAKRLGLAGEEAQFPPTVTAAYRGHFSEAITEEIGSYRWLIALAIPPSEYEKVTGDSLDQLTDYPHLNRIWDALDNQPDSPLLQDPAQILVAMGQFVLTSSGGPYAIEPTNRLWNAFKLAVQNRPSEMNVSQEQLLREPVFIPHRPLKDPREIRLLDPACGSMHFGLYAFDLFEVIYEEVWDSHPEFLEDLRKAVSDKREFLILVPKLIIEHNLHGIEIDPRCTQIAGLSLWLRAQKSWQRRGLKLSERPRIARSNIVSGEPMPGEKELLREFTTQLSSSAIGQLVELIFDKMQLVGEAGSLLKIEEEIWAVVAEAKSLWRQGPKYEQAKLFGDVPGKPEQQEFKLDLSGITDELFWEKAEGQIYTALREYSEAAQDDSGYQRQLFTDDVAQGFSFIDLCRKRYDVILMNPPFGQPATRIKPYAAARYENYWHDMYSIFVARGVELLNPRGTLGAITASTYLNLSTFEKFRTFLIEEIEVKCLIELGSGVMDDAAVSAACLVISSESPSTSSATVFANFAGDEDSACKLLSFVSRLQDCALPEAGRIIPIKIFARFPNRMMTYWIPDTLFHVFSEMRSLKDKSTCTVGLHTRGNEDRFYRAWWEPAQKKDYAIEWPVVKVGGNPQHFCRDNPMVVNWNDNARELKVIASQASGGTFTGNEYYFRRGISYIYTGQTTFSAQPLEEGCVFSIAAPAIFVQDDADLLPLLALLNSEPVRLLLKVINPNRFFQAVYVKLLPLPKYEPVAKKLGELASKSIEEAKKHIQGDECSRLFVTDWTHGLGSTIDMTIDRAMELARVRGARLAEFKKDLDELARDSYQISHSDLEYLQDWVGSSTAQVLPGEDAPLLDDKSFLVSSMISYAVGCVFGRWDIRFSTDEKKAQEIHDPFAPLPVCPPGQLQNEQGLPAAPFDLPPTYPLRISWPGILVDAPNHRDDIECRVREVIEVILKKRGEAIEHQACDILGVRSIREYFSKPTGFFADHFERYSKSRRQAPIYWPLSTASGSYTVWIYYHRLDEDFLYTVVNGFVSPKIIEIERDLARIETNLLKATGREATKLREGFEETKSFLAELQDFKAELLRVAALPYKPNLNDGVLITAAPLWKLFRLPKWRNDLKECWEQLEAGEYDWAHLAYSIWTERVREKCKKDRSLAVAHGLESLCEARPAGENAKPRRKRKAKAAASAES